MNIRFGTLPLNSVQRKQVEDLIAAAGGCPPLSRTFCVDRGAPAGGDGSACAPFQTIQEALDAIGDAVSDAEFNDNLTARVLVDVQPGVYVEDLAVPTRQLIILRLRGVKIIGNVDWSLDGTVMDGAVQQAKLLVVGDDLRNAYNLASQPVSDAIVGNVTVAVIGGVGSLNFAQLHVINAGVTGNVKGDLPAGGLAFSFQLFCENAIIGTSGAGATGFECAVGIAGTLYAANSDTSSSFSFGKVSGQINLNAVRNVRFRGPVVVNSPHGRWFNVEFASGLAHNFTGSSGGASVDYVSFVSYFKNVPTKGAETFTILDVLAGTTANRPTAQVNTGTLYFDTTLGIPVWRSGAAWVDATGAAA